MDRVLFLVEHYGYLVVFFAVMLEGIGVPLPGEAILLASGFLAQQGHLDVGDTIVFGILGAVYYERWAAAAELLVVEKGLLTKKEIDARAAEVEQRWGEA